MKHVLRNLAAQTLWFALKALAGMLSAQMKRIAFARLYVWILQQRTAITKMRAGLINQDPNTMPWVRVIIWDTAHQEQPYILRMEELLGTKENVPRFAATEPKKLTKSAMTAIRMTGTGAARNA